MAIVRDSPCGKKVAVVEPYTKKINVSNKTDELFSITHTDFVRSLSWSPSGDKIASSIYENAIFIWNGTNGNLIRKITDINNIIRVFSWSPNGLILACGSEKGSVLLFDPIKGSLLGTLRGHTHYITSIVWSSDGLTLASSTLLDKIIWSVETGKIIQKINQSIKYQS